MIYIVPVKFVFFYPNHLIKTSHVLFNLLIVIMLIKHVITFGVLHFHSQFFHFFGLALSIIFLNGFFSPFHFTNFANLQILLVLIQVSTLIKTCHTLKCYLESRYLIHIMNLQEYFDDQMLKQSFLCLMICQNFQFILMETLNVVINSFILRNRCPKGRVWLYFYATNDLPRYHLLVLLSSKLFETKQKLNVFLTN